MTHSDKPPRRSAKRTLYPAAAARGDIRAGLREPHLRIEVRLDGSMAVRFRDRYLEVGECSVRPKAVASIGKLKKLAPAPRPKSQWMKTST